MDSTNPPYMCEAEFQRKYADEFSANQGGELNYKYPPVSTNKLQQQNFENNNRSGNGNDSSLSRALGSSRERMKNHLANSFTRNEEISILPGFKQSKVQPQARRNVNLHSTICQEESNNPNNARLQFSRSLKANLQNSVYREESPVSRTQNQNKLDSKLNRSMAQSVYKKALDEQIQQRDNIRKQESFTNNPVNSSNLRSTQSSTNVSVRVEENTGYLPPWFQPKFNIRQSDEKILSESEQNNSQMKMASQASQNNNSVIISPEANLSLSQNDVFYLQQQNKMEFRNKQSEIGYRQTEYEINSYQNQAEVVYSENSDQNRNSPLVPSRIAEFYDGEPQQGQPSNFVSNKMPQAQQQYLEFSERSDESPPQQINRHLGNAKMGMASPFIQENRLKQCSGDEFVNASTSLSHTDILNTQLLKLHVSQTADQRPDERLLMKKYNAQLQQQIEERRRKEEERIAREKIEEDLLQRKIEEEQEKMKFECEEEDRRKKRKEEEFNQMQELAFKKSVEILKKAEENRERERQKKRNSHSRLSSTGEIDLNSCGDSSLIGPNFSKREIMIKNEAVDSGLSIDMIQHFEEPALNSPNPILDTGMVSSRKLIKPKRSPSQEQNTSILSELKKVIMIETSRMELEIGRRASQ